MSLQNRFSNIISSWFYYEPLLFGVITSHEIIKNENMNIPMRSGQFRIEYNPLFFEKKSDSELEEYLKVECYRILLSHPYKRLPYNAKKNILFLASDVTVYSFYRTDISLAGVEYLKSLSRRFKDLTFPLGEKWANTDEEKFFMRNLNINHRTGKLELVDDISFEEWYSRILFLITEISTNGKNAGYSENIDKSLDYQEACELWEENDEARNLLKANIKKADIDEGWGSVGGGLKRKIEESSDFCMDYRRMLTQFRQNIISSKRNLTRMKPSRRFGFESMGSRYQRKANILIAVDVSGSISNESFNRFFTAINNIFFLGIIEKIDVIFFDVSLKLPTPISFKKKINLSDVQGLGGTNFQSAIDFFETHSEYNGFIIFTDGQGNIPIVHKKQNILWILTSRSDFIRSRSWIESLNGNKATYMPF